MTQERSVPAARWSELTAPVITGLLIIVGLGPLFLQLPLTNDAVLYDLEARWLQEGIAPYRDIVEPNFPGVILIHQCVRTALGESNAALRAFDLICQITVLLLLARLTYMCVDSLRMAGWMVVLGVLFYLSQSEWCHCQRDVWLLLPVVTAVVLRIQQIRRGIASSGGWVFGHSLLEGLVWGAAIWLKPHALVICVAMWLLSLLVAVGWRVKIADSLGLLAGGLLAGIAGILALQRLGILDDFLASLSVWNPRYLDARWDNWTLKRYLGMSFFMAPWPLLHLIALPLSCWTILVFVSNSLRRHERFVVRASLATVYVIWFAQAHLLQHLFDYVHVPALILCLAVIASHAAEVSLIKSRWLLVPFVGLAVWSSPLARPQQVSLWRDAVLNDISPAQKDRLARLPNPRWSDLSRVEHYLKEQQVQNTDVLMYNSDLVTLYWNLKLKSPTPYVYLYELTVYFPDLQEEMLAEAQLQTDRFAVTDLVAAGMSPADAEAAGDASTNGLPPKFYQVRRRRDLGFPWMEPVVFRSGRYLVHELSRAESESAVPTEN